MDAQPPGPEKLAVSVNDAAVMVSVGRDAVFALVLSGALPSFRVGRRRLIPVDGLRAWVQAQAAAGAADEGG